MRKFVFPVFLSVMSVLLALSIAATAYAVANYQPNAYTDGIRGGKYPIWTIITTPEGVRDAAAAQGLIPDANTNVMGFARFNKALTTCTIWVPPLGFDTLWIWAHEIKHCNEGDFHAK